MQYETMQLDVAISLLKKTEMVLQTYRAIGFVAAQTSAKDMCKEINVEAII